LAETWEILTIENNFFCSWAVLTIPYFWRFSSYYHSFNDGNFSWVDKKHPYEMDEKKLPKRALDEPETNDKKMHRKCIHTQ
jgi:hypothetical protein